MFCYLSSTLTILFYTCFLSDNKLIRFKWKWMKSWSPAGGLKHPSSPPSLSDGMGSPTAGSPRALADFPPLPPCAAQRCVRSIFSQRKARSQRSSGRADWNVRSGWCQQTWKLIGVWRTQRWTGPVMMRKHRPASTPWRRWVIHVRVPQSSSLGLLNVQCTFFLL